MAAVKDMGDMIAPCCWSGVCGLVEEAFRLPWERLGAGYIPCAAAAAAAAAGSMRAAEALAIAEALYVIGTEDCWSRFVPKAVEKVGWAGELMMEFPDIGVEFIPLTDCLRSTIITISLS